jgi:hypothetical protein
MGFTLVMPGLVPGIHVFLSGFMLKARRGWPGRLARRRASRFGPAMTERESSFYSSTACSGATDCLRSAALLEPIISASGMAQSVMIITI